VNDLQATKQIVKMSYSIKVIIAVVIITSIMLLAKQNNDIFQSWMTDSIAYANPRLLLPSQTSSPLEKSNSSSKNTVKLPKKSSVRRIPSPRNDTPGNGWIYEPPNVKYFWNRMADRKFISGLYPHLSSYQNILDVGARGYNRYCKELLNSSTSKYFQVEPFPPKEMHNDGLLACKVQEIPDMYPQFKEYFDAVLDFGVFGWKAVHEFNSTEQMMQDIDDYMKGLLFVLKPRGLWLLKIDGGWVPNEKTVFDMYILPNFDMGRFQNWSSGIKPTKRPFSFYFLYRKNSVPKFQLNPQSNASLVSSDSHDKLEPKSEHTFNPIQIENNLPGTPDWILTNPALDREIEGYMSRTSIQKGNTILLFYNTRAPSVSIEVFRTGWYNGDGARRFYGPIIVPGMEQFIPKPDTYGTVACNWTNPHVVYTNMSWTTGVYLARLTEQRNGTQSYTIFVVRDDSPEEQPEITFQLPVNTYQAYNYWGSKSLYGWGSVPGRRGLKVSFDRPYTRGRNPAAAYGNGAGEYLTNIQPIESYPISSSAAWNYNMVRWLERNGIDVSYITNVDTHIRLPRLRKPKIFMTQGHDEYWSWQMRDHVEGWRDEGVHLTFMGSNTAYMQVRFENPVEVTTENDLEPRILVCFRFIRKDPIKNHLRSTKFRETRHEAYMVGVGYIGDPFDTDLIVKDSSHWLFQGTGLNTGDSLPGLLGYEVDGIEEALVRNQQRTTTILFETPVIDRMNQTLHCHGVVYTTGNGSVYVFSPGTMQWSWALDNYNAFPHQGLRTSRFHPSAEIITWNFFLAAGIPKRSSLVLPTPNPAQSQNTDIE
jgi:hypothetical protein